jgi:hypothetical protein
MPVLLLAGTRCPHHCAEPVATAPDPAPRTGRPFTRIGRERRGRWPKMTLCDNTEAVPVPDEKQWRYHSDPRRRSLGSPWPKHHTVLLCVGCALSHVTGGGNGGFRFQWDRTVIGGESW